MTDDEEILRQVAEALGWGYYGPGVTPPSPADKGIFLFHDEGGSMYLWNGETRNIREFHPLKMLDSARQLEEMLDTWQTAKCVSIHAKRIFAKGAHGSYQVRRDFLLATARERTLAWLEAVKKGKA